MLTTKTDCRNGRLEDEAEELERSIAQHEPGTERDEQDRRARRTPRRAHRRRRHRAWPRPGKIRERNAAANGDGARRRASPAVVASRVGYSDPPKSACQRPFARGPRPHPDPRPDVPPVNSKPDLVAQEHEILRQWAERRTFARLRAQNAGGPRWSFLDGPITANNPMGVHHAWGRAYKDLYQRFHAMLGEDQRYQNGFDCQGLWVEVNVERDLGFTSKRDIEAYGIAEFVTLCKQRVLTYAARQTEQSIRLGMWMDWNDPDELRRLRDLLGADPAPGRHDPGARRPRDRHRRDARRAARDARRRRQLLHVQQREQRPDLGVPRRVPPARLALQGPRHDAVVPALRDRPLPDGDERGLPGPRGPGPDRPVPARRPARRGAAGLDDHAVDADVERRGRGRPGRCATSGSARATTRSGSARGRSSRRSQGPFEVARGGAGRRAGRLALRRARSTTCRPSATAFAAGTRDAPDAVRASRRRLDRGRRGGGDRASSTSPRAAAPRTSSSARRSACRSSAPIDEDGIVLDGLRLADRPRGARDVAEPIVERPRARGPLLPPRAVHPPLPALLALRHAAALPPRRRVVHQHGPGLRPAARDADEGAGRRQPALPDHGGRRPDPLDPGLRLRARARLAPATCTTG